VQFFGGLGEAQHTTDFSAIGAAFNGNMRYNSGFGAAFAVPAAYTGATTPAVFSSALYCAANAAQCTTIPSNGVAPTVVAAGATATAVTFIAEANASIFNAATDVWRINDAKAVTNPTPGIP
jgi:hypothetical protein